MERKSLTFLKLGILFLFLDFNVGRMDLMPDFAGMLFLFVFITSHDLQTETERRLKPLLLILAADYFLHWIIQFYNPLEGLLASVVFIYVIFVFLGEVMKRIREEQPERVLHLNFARMGTALLLTANFILDAYENNTLNGVLVISFLMMLIFLLVEVCGIRPCRS